MSIWRTAARLAAVLAAAAGLVLAGAAPALAAPYSVGLGLPSSFRVGGSPGAVTVKITKGEDGCVNARWGVNIRLPGMSSDQIRVERALNGSWHRVSAQSVDDGAVAFGADGPLCKGRAITARYRVSFLAGAPTGQATFVARASVFGRSIGSDSGTRKVVAGKNSSPSPKPSPSDSPSESPTPAADATGEAADELAVAPTPAAAGGSAGGGFLSGVSLVIMIFGALMVGIGGTLLYVIIRKIRPEPESEFETPPPDDPYPTMVLPRIPPQ
jgi:hypothetical protein